MVDKSVVEQCISKLNFKFPYSADEWLKLNMVMENYHKHTTWSDLVQIDSATDIVEFMQKLDSYGCKSLFSGEHGYQGEWLYVYDLCNKSLNPENRKKMKLSNPLKFRYSTEMYWVKDADESEIVKHIDKKGKKSFTERKDNKNCHIVIVARNYNAMRKLNYLISKAHEDGYYYKPRTDLKELFKLTGDDVYITSACTFGWKYEDADQIWLKIHEHFGDSFFLEYQAHNTDEQKKLNKKISSMAKKHGIQTIVGLDTHYINEEDKIKRDNLLKRKKTQYPEENGWYMDFPNGKEVYRRMKEQGVLNDEEIIVSMLNTHIFTDGCEDVTYDTGFKIPILDEYKNYTYEQRVDILKQILNENYKIKETEKSKEKVDGIRYEYGEIKDSGTVDYFLDNYKLVHLATSEEYGGVLTTTSRGSAASYYTSKLLGFTTIDRFNSEVPIYPQRFVTKDRILSSHQMPDIDFNVAKQSPFVKAGKELFGEYGCVPLLAVGKLGEKSGFKLYADIKGIDSSIANDISKCIEQYNEALKQVDDEDDKENIFIEDYITDKKYLTIFNDSKPYQGIIEQAKVHACGYLLFNGNQNQTDVIGYGDIRYEIGLIRCVSKSGNSTIVACVEGGLLDAYGYVKDDFLIVDVVGIIDKLYKSIMNRVPSTTELRKMVAYDKPTWDLYANGITCCLNQCEKPSTTKKAMKYKPQNIKELAAFIAGIRPGFKSLINGFLERIEYTSGEKAIDELLEDCFHYMLYQESVMNIFSYLGIPIEDSYDTIKKISKKKLVGEALQKVKKSMKEHWNNNIGNTDNFEPVYKVVKNSAKYSFNAPHALSMANDSLYEAWSKAHYTPIFYEVTLNHYQEKKDKNKVADLLREATTYFGYSIGKYEYGKDNSKFTVDDKEKIIYPDLASVKGMGKQTLIDLLNIYQRGIDDFVEIRKEIKGTSVDRTIFRDLTKIGYFKRYGSIKKLLKILDIYEYWQGSSGIGRKTISKKDIESLGLDKIDIKKYATDVLETGNISKTQYSNANWLGIVKALSCHIPNDEYGIATLAKFQVEVLGYVDIIDENIDPRYTVITELDTKYSPKFIGYCLQNGKTAELKIHKRKNYNNKSIKVSFNDCPVEDGDVIYLRQWKREQSRKKVGDNEWKDIPGVFDNWIKDYYKIEM